MAKTRTVESPLINLAEVNSAVATLMTGGFFSFATPPAPEPNSRDKMPFDHASIRVPLTSGWDDLVRRLPPVFQAPFAYRQVPGHRGLIGAVKGGVKGINPTVVVAVLADGANEIEVSAWAKEGFIAQLAATKVIEGLAASYRQG